ncbi:MAG TPA: LysR family transcriptional regulator [Polyangiales bacterium]|nr:LysR family transcriptional regulator [Polyangiales bacterium]
MTDIDAEKIKKLDGSLLLVLRELLRQRRATLAARRLGLSQSAVSHALGRLRELFEDPLFVRKPYGLEPTRHALELAPRIDALLDAMQAAMGLPNQFSASTTTRGFRIAAPDHVTTLLAPLLVARLAREAPQARVAFSQRLGHDAQQALLRDELDLALGRFAQRDERLVMQALYEDRYCLVARRDHPLLRKRLTPARYAQLDQVQVSVSADFRAPDFAHGDRAWRPRRTIAAVPRFLIAFAVVSQTQTVAIAPARLAQRHARAFNLRIHGLPFSLEPISVMIARRSHLDAGTAFLIEQLQLIAAQSD